MAKPKPSRIRFLKKEVSVFVGINPTEFEDHFKQKFSTIAEEFERLSSIAFVTFDGRKLAPLTIAYLTQDEAIIARLFGREEIRRTRHFLKFTALLKISSKKEWEENENHFLNFEYYVNSYIRLLLIYLNLAKPGAFHVHGGYSVIVEKIDVSKRRVDSFDPLLSILPESLHFQVELQWPPIKSYDLCDFYNWLTNHWQSFETRANNRLQRALNAFSYLFHDTLVHESDGDIFYSILGIEALFVVGKDGIQKQVDEKTQLLFGRRQQFQKRFSQMYDFRSRYVHGQLDLTNKFHVDDNNEESVDSHLRPLYENCCFAILILVASIQKHFELNKEHIDFELTLKP